ncbi:MAG TPA: BON domain-containing protein, partial [Xanthomonadales bacterium]|nr:BON domain-containing protein [Xanthomonadales bacterium]
MAHRQPPARSGSPQDVYGNDGTSRNWSIDEPGGPHGGMQLRRDHGRAWQAGGTWDDTYAGDRRREAHAAAEFHPARFDRLPEGRGDHVAARGGGAAPGSARARRGPRNYVRSDERIAEDIYETLADDAWIDASGIALTVTGGIAILEGEVPDRRAKHYV